ncbi:hypothetical protein CROQUDRAFT_98464 [Cronartium quercuum f. sp. fusiforme G11]|uniref:Uncharacterized protein n=1 Tax=Cronartium quercuum f. sp. fusiforme G11 TaxID=708437 RepID=A0A9P6NDI2_9BASI|nr:hypothetical protein CROQUDRAFT_98464 [Cronartium quercuum f. sp. fusiforme G11]
MLRLFYLYLVININLRVNCVFVETQVEDAIESSQKYSKKKTPETQDLLGFLNQKYFKNPPETRDLLSLVGSATTNNLDSQLPTVEEGAIAGMQSSLMNSPPRGLANSAENQILRTRNGNRKTSNPNHTSQRGQPAKVAKTTEVSAILSRKPTQKLKFF